MNLLKKPLEWLKSSTKASTGSLDNDEIKRLLIDWLLISLFVPLPIYLMREYHDGIRLGVAMLIVVTITFFDIAQKLVDLYEKMRSRKLRK